LSGQEQADGRVEARQRHAQVSLVSSVVDPDSFNPDTDPPFQVNLDPPDPIRILCFDDQKLKKKNSN
jgi:hypothetical protein